MRFPTITIVILSLLFGAVCDAREPATKKQVDSSRIESSAALMKKAIDAMPNTELKKGLTEYLRIVKPDAYGSDRAVGSSNAGLNSVNSEAFSNQCFARVAKNFYSDIASVIRRSNRVTRVPSGKESFSSNDLVNYGESLPDRRRSTILEVAGESNNSDLQPGWVWNLALKNSGGNRNLAMKLIGVCGHDDVGQGYYAIKDSSPEALEIVKKEVASQKQIRASYIADMKKSRGEELKYLRLMVSGIDANIASLEKKKTLERQLRCPPQNSEFYVPKSLSAEADIPKALKNELVAVQGQGRAFMPAKYYHVYGSASVVCTLIERGVKPALAVRLQTTAASIYRGIRICEATKLSLTKYSELEGLFKAAKGKFGKTFEEWLVGVNKKCSTLDFGKNSYCDETRTYVDLDSGGRLTDAQMASKLRKKIERSDAAFLRENWYAGGNELFGYKMPCRNARRDGPKDLMNPTGDFWGRTKHPKTWSEERYRNATRVLRTWDLDFEWTEAQHKAGSQFAAKNCHESKASDRTALARMCSADKTTKPALSKKSVSTQ